jgi:glycosyltransferase involved in cell wall biosynthesis/GT2 family glycosyltransferase
MRVLFLFPYRLSPTGVNAGAAEATIGLMKEFAARGNEVSCAVLEGFSEEQQAGGVSFFSFASLPTVISFKKIGAIDAVFVVLFDNQIRKVERILDRMPPGTIKAAIYHNAVFDKTDYQLWRFLNFKVDYLITVCDYAKREAEAWGITASKIRVARNAIRQELRVAASGKSDCTKEDGSLLFAGALVPHKGIHLLLDAFCSLADSKLKLYVAGSPGLWGTGASFTPKKNWNRPNVKFLGELEAGELVRAYQKCQIIVLPSQMESSGLSVLEAMAFKCIPVVSNRGGITETVVDLKNGLWLEELSVDGVKKGIKKAIALIRDDPEGASRLREEACKTAISRTWPEAYSVASEAIRQPRTREEPGISVVIPTANRPHEIGRMTASVLNGSLVPSEIIIVDQSKSFETRDTVTALSKTKSTGAVIKYVHDKGSGIARAKNIGTKAASGTIIAFTDDDARVDSDWAAGILDAYERIPDAGIVSGPIKFSESDQEAKTLPIYYSQHKYLLPFYEQAEDFGEFCGSSTPAGVNFAIRKQLLQSLGGFDRRFGANKARLLQVYGEDALLARRVRDAGFKIVYSSKVKVYHPIRPERLSLKHLLRRLLFEAYTQQMLLPTMSRKRTMLELIRELISYLFVLKNKLLRDFTGFQCASAQTLGKVFGLVRKLA